MVRSSLMFGLLLSCAGLAGAFDDKIDGKLLIGKWEPDNLPPGYKLTMEFMKGNKIIYVGESQGGKPEKVEGTYKVEGNRLTIQLKRDGKELNQTATIIKLTGKECTFKNDNGREEQTIKKVP